MLLVCMRRSRFNKPFRIFAFSLLATITLIIVTSAMLSMFYEKAVIRFMKNYLDEHLRTQLSMDEIKFRALKGFPNATVEITNVVLLSGEDFTRTDFSGSFSDTLLKANSVMFQFDLLKLFNKQYELKKIEVSVGMVNILFDRKNRHNLNIWRTSDTTTTKYAVNLKGIVLNAIRINLISLNEQLYLKAISEKTTFKGTFSGNVLSGESRGNFSLPYLTIKDKRLLKDASLRLALKLTYSGSRIRIREGRIALNKAVATIAGEYQGGKNRSVDLILNVQKFGLNELMSLMPLDGKSLAGHFEFSGNGNLNAVIRGSLTNRKDLLIKSEFELNNCTARNTITKTEISDINLHGTVSGTRQENFSLQIDKVNSTMGKGSLGGSFTMRNLNTLLFGALIQGDIDLEALKSFVGMDTLEYLTGMVSTEFTVAGKLRQLLADSSVTALDFIEKGTFLFRDAGIKLKSFPLPVQHISGKATWDQAVRLDSLSFRINDTDLLVSGNLRNVTGYLHQQGLLKSYLEITTDNLDINRYLNKSTGSKSSSKSKARFWLPSAIYVKASLKAKNFTAGKFVASDLALNMSSMHDSIYVDNYYLKFPNGSITGNALITSDPQHMLSITCNADPQKINIQQLFTAFNNFTQHFIVDKNVKGLLNGTISFFVQWDSTYKFVPKSMKAKGEFEITNGELVQFEPMMRLSKYIDLDELRHIRFKTLKNSIFINDRLVTIPEMAINSTAFNISVSGQHSFDNVFDYRMKVLLSDVLFNKARKKKREIEDFLVEETTADQTTVPLIIAGTPNDFDVRFDRKKAFSLTRNTMKNKAKSDESKMPPQNFKIEWEEPEEKIVEKKPVPEKKESDFLIEWEEEEDP